MTKEKSRGITKHKKRDFGDIFIISIFCSFAFYLLMAVFTGGESLKSIFFQRTGDIFMDFFNSVRDASRGKESYTVRKIIYPPLANLFFLFVSLFTNKNYNRTAFEDRQTWHIYTSSFIVIGIFIFVCLFLLAFLIYECLKGQSRQKRLLFTSAAILSVPVLNMLERGNILCFSLIFLMIFALTYESKNKTAREAGLISLALSFSIKLYPLMFAWILLGDKRYKDFARCLLYSLILLIIPSFAFGGPSCILTMIKNILSFSEGKSGALMFVCELTSVKYSSAVIIEYILLSLCVLAFAFAPFVLDDFWKLWAIGCITFIAFPPLTMTYAWTFFLIPIIIFCKKKRDLKRHSAFLIPILLPFLFFPSPIMLKTTVNTVIVYIIIKLLSVFAVIDIAVLSIKKIKNMHRNV